MRLRQTAWAILAGVAILLCLAAFVALRVCIMPGLAQMKHAYEADRAASCTIDAVEKFVRERGTWPSSWKELESATSSDDFLPDGGWDEIRNYVEINFDLTLDEAANLQIESFDAIKPKPPARDAYRYHLDRLLETVRSVRNASGSPTENEAVN